MWIDEGHYGETDRLFTEDAVVNSARGEARGIGALIELVHSGPDTYVRTLHSKSNLIIEVDGETATVRAHDIAVFLIDDNAEALAAGFHHYGARRTEDGWQPGRTPSGNRTTLPHLNASTPIRQTRRTASTASDHLY